MIASITSIDLAILDSLYAVRDPALVQIFIWVSELASTTTVAGLSAIVLIVLAYRKRWALAAGLATSVFGSAAGTLILKELAARPRPSRDFAAYVETGFSFPSWHATGVVALYGFLLWMMWEKLSPSRRKIKIVAVAIIILLVGFSRPYLGVHYVSDVLAGYLLGTAFLWIGINVTKRLRWGQ